MGNTMRIGGEAAAQICDFECFSGMKPPDVPPIQEHTLTASSNTSGCSSGRFKDVLPFLLRGEFAPPAMPRGFTSPQ